MPNDVSQAIVTERSQQLLSYAYLRYVGILGVLNDIRKTIPLLSAVHSRDFGYMANDVNRYTQNLKNASNEMGITIQKVKQLGTEARRVGISEGAMTALYGGIQDRISRKGFDWQSYKRYTQQEQLMTALGVDMQKFRQVPETQKADYIQKALVHSYARIRSEQGIDAATRVFRQAEHFGMLDQGMTGTIAQLAEKTTLVGQNDYEIRQAKGRSYEAARKRSMEGRGVGGLREFRKEMQQQGRGVDIVSDESIAKTEKFNKALVSLEDTLAKTRERYTALVVAANIDFLTKATVAVEKVVELFGKFADRVEVIIEKMGVFSKLPFAQIAGSLTKLIALAIFFGTVFPWAISLVITRLGLLNTTIGTVAISASSQLKWMLSPIHMIIGAVDIMSKAIMAAIAKLSTYFITAAINLYVLAQNAGSVTAAVGALLSSLWGVMKVSFANVIGGLAAAGVAAGLFALKLTLVTAAVWAIVEAFNMIYEVMGSLLGFTDKFSWGFQKIAAAYESMFGNKDIEDKYKNLIKDAQDFGKAGGEAADTVAAKMRAMSEQDLFGRFFDQIINLPDRILPKAMSLIKMQLKNTHGSLEEQMLGVIKIDNQMRTTLTVKDQGGNVIDAAANSF